MQSPRASRSKRKRAQQGNTIAELGPTLILVFIVFTIPLIAMATMMYRYVWVINAAHLASSQASRAQGGTWAATKAKATSVIASIFNASSSAGVVPGTTTVQLWVCPPSGSGTPSLVAGPFVPPAAGIGGYVFNVQVTVNASIRPLIYTKGASWGWMQIPGLTSPLNVAAVSSTVIESPQGAL